jgi:tRNA(Ile)-lysidine synthase
MRTDLVERVQATGLIRPGRRVLVMLSGGRDSVCLLDVAVRIAGAEVVEAMHVDYGLRADSADDAAACAALCERLGVELHLRRPLGSPVGNVQAWARDERIGAALGHVESWEPMSAATAHTASDQAETILYRLASSPSRRALLGMDPTPLGPFVRPLLGVTRAETTAWCEGHGLPWRDDPTNDTAVYARNRVRNQLMPALREIHPAAERNIARVAEVLRLEEEVLEELVQDTLQEPVTLPRLRALPFALARLVVVRLAEDAAGRLVPRAASRTAEILALDETRAWTALDVGDGVRAVVEGGRLRFEAPGYSRSQHA